MRALVALQHGYVYWKMLLLDINGAKWLLLFMFLFKISYGMTYCYLVVNHWSQKLHPWEWTNQYGNFFCQNESSVLLERLKVWHFTRGQSKLTSYVDFFACRIQLIHIAVILIQKNVIFFQTFKMSQSTLWLYLE